MYAIHTTEVKDSGATYLARNRKDVCKAVERLLDHGRRTYGDKIVKIVIESGVRK